MLTHAQSRKCGFVSSFLLNKLLPYLVECSLLCFDMSPYLVECSLLCFDMSPLPNETWVSLNADSGDNETKFHFNASVFDE